MGIFRPRNRFYRVTDITPEFLLENGIDTLLLDADNTLSLHHSLTPHEGVPEWLDEMRKNGIKLMIVSNSNEMRVGVFAAVLGLPFEYRSLKPLPRGIKRALSRLGSNKEHTALVGDQLLTDVLGARLAGVRMLLVRYIKKEDGVGFRIKRGIEKVVLAGLDYKKKGDK